VFHLPGVRPTKTHGVTDTADARDVWLTAADGTRLFALDAGPIEAQATPILCLPGLTRHHRDFEPVFEQFSQTRRIVAVDYRGRGKSDFADDPATYNPAIELQDVILLLDQLGLERVAVIGVSRGGIIGMMMANLHAARLAGLMLVDIGPELEIEGLRRIASYAGKERRFVSWDDAADGIATTSHGFSDVTLAQWKTAAKRIFAEREGAIVATHDPAIAQSLPDLTSTDSLDIDLWPLTEPLGKIPTALLYGLNSDLLSKRTVDRMRTRIPGLHVQGIAGRGHVPFLDEPESITAITSWLSRIA
jgi:pimeloyl-ACP methyl ester carboxylesterase